MQPDLQLAMHRALEMGPGHCPPDLFAGSVAAIVSGLKAHSTTIALARYSALCDSFPRTRALIGDEAFDEAAGLFLDRADVLARTLDAIGEDFPALLDGPAADLARLETAWLEAYRSPDSQALQLSDLAGKTASEVASIRCVAHPAARTVALESGQSGGEVLFDGISIRSLAIITRPDSEVEIAEAPAGTAAMLDSLDGPATLGDLLELDADSASALVTSGALAPAEEDKA